MKNIRHAGLVVSNIRKSLRFYRDLLGLSIKRDMDEQGAFIDTILGFKKVHVRTVKLTAKNGSLVELLCYRFPVSKKNKKMEINDIGRAHVAFTVTNIEREYARLSSKGIHFISHPQKSPDGRAKVAFCRDPEGNFIELVEELKV